MSLRKLPEPKALSRPKGYEWEPQGDALEHWKPRAAEADDANTISIYDAIGVDWWTGEGTTAKRIAGALRAIGKNPVTVNINSYGGDMFEGLAIYNLLREHPAEVTVRVMAVAASAASIIAMAGDRIEMGLGSFIMIHNSWGGVVGNQHDMRAAAELFAEFDGAMSDIYAARSGADATDILALMEKDTWMRPATAIEMGFADATFEVPDYEDTPAASAKSALARLDVTLAKAGLPRSERRRLIKEATGTQDAAGHTTPSAGFDLDAMQRLLTAITI